MRPRRISAYEAQIIRRVLEVGADISVSQTLLDSIDNLLVQEEGAGDFLHDSLDFAAGHGNDKIIAGALGLMANGAPVEMTLWVRDGAISYLGLDPWAGSLRPTRMPILESIRPYVAADFGAENEEETTPD
jgi:hypothetical protein